MQDRLWNNIANIKFKAIYTGRVSRRAYYVGNSYSMFLAFASASSVAAWAFWNIYPTIWASIVGVSQLLHIAKPYIPFIKSDKEFMEMSLLYEQLYLEYEKLWYDYKKTDADANSIEKKFYSLREKELSYNSRFKHIVCPEFTGLLSKSDQETNNYLESNF